MIEVNRYDRMRYAYLSAILYRVCRTKDHIYLIYGVMREGDMYGRLSGVAIGREG